MVHGLIPSHTDFCNGLYSDIPAYQIDRLQKRQTSESSKPSNQNSFQFFIWPTQVWNFKNSALVTSQTKSNVQNTGPCFFHIVQGTAPLYSGSMLKCVQGWRSLRSSNEIQFVVPRTRIRTADRSFGGIKMVECSNKWH